MEILNSLKDLFSSDSGASAVLSFFTFLIRIVLPILAIMILSRCTRSLLREKQDTEVWGWLSLPNGSRIPLDHWENIIGRSKTCDAYLEYPTLSRIHAAVIRDDKGNWKVYDLESKGGVFLNGNEIDVEAPICRGDVLNLGGVELVFIPLSAEEEREQTQMRARPGREIKPATTMLLLTEFQLLLGLQLCISYGSELKLAIPVCFAGLVVLTWCYYIFMRALRRVGLEIETIAFFLSSIGLSVVATSSPDNMYKQFLILIAGVVTFLILGWFLRDLDRAKKLRWPIAAAGLVFLAVNVVLAKALMGAKNWLSIGGMSIQPSEFVKICFVFAGAATLDRIFVKRNLLLFIAFAGACVGALAIISDFGTALIFFAAYLVIAFIRSGSFATVLLSAGGAGFAGFLALTFKPYIAERFSTWGNAWQFVNDSGYQQTRTMSAAASGGLFGVGAGNGWLQSVYAADTDMVFGIVCEELGLIIGALAIAAVIIMAIFVIKSSATARSSFYVIAASAAVTMLMFQIILNVFGSLDILPFTGVTFPFVSRGGSSLIACWGLLAFIKAADTRQNASFTVKLPSKRVSKRSAEDAEDVEDMYEES